mmetsp:Transcript_20559/g.46640  ORF Transcript_20559/g.46640 Transcript_20559/m.46640 type:complete len:232 (-) Transcript_20559:62-757(-)
MAHGALLADDGDETSTKYKIPGILRKGRFGSGSSFSDSRNTSIDLSSVSGAPDFSDLDCFGNNDLNVTSNFIEKSNTENKDEAEFDISLDGADPQLSHVQLHDSQGRNVSFSRLRILEFLPILGDHPSCRCGPPITIAAEPSNEMFVDLDEYEALKANGEGRSKDQDLYLTSFTRRWTLTEECGYSPADLRKAQRKVKVMKKNRERSLNRQKVEIRFSKSLKKLKNTFAAS